MEMADLDDKAIDLLETRISRIENQLFGNAAIPSEKSTSIIDSLLAANTFISAAANSRENIQKVYQRLDELMPNLTEDALCDPLSEFERKLNVVFSLEKQHHNNTTIMEKISSLDAALNDGSLEGLDELQPQLTELVDQYSTLRKQIGDTDRTDELQRTWEALMLEVSKSLVAANNALAEVENDKK